MRKHSTAAEAYRQKSELLACIELVLAIHKHGSITDAAAALGLSQSALSRQLVALEATLEVSLFKRTTRTIAPSDVGRILIESGQDVLRAADILMDQIRSASGAPRLLRVATPPYFGRKHILPHLQEFRRKNPSIDIRLILSDERVDVIREDVDLAIRIGHLPDQWLVAARIAKQRRVLCASPAYLATKSAIRHPEDLSNHQCLVHTRLAPTGIWHCWSGKSYVAKKVSGPLASNYSDVLVDAAVRGMGVALIANWTVNEFLAGRQLVPLLPNWRIDSDLEPRDISFVWAPQLSQSRQVRSFVSHFRNAFGKPPYWELPLS
ncbi:LysR family transcriptional regulator [Bradyrhizobium jicamae]|uniref:LysR family transcriptional regulator n=1 Tax=Bradyrhizobium jicamae TaxID=280332 RepID=UPI001BAADFDE|nr:LysR family transcriptional regulator [Bradyrhizobium jicamae]MBR0751266.1 LysR family transcriptional regulator [Bradyrhizobium jicamae]